jgi:hypothetical protein
MSDNRGEQRAETARRTDDSGIIDSAEDAPGFSGTSGGNLQRDVAAQAEEERVSDPEGHEGVSKTDKLEYGEGSVTPKSGDSNAGS